MTLCERCFQEENFPKLMQKADFEMESVKAQIEGKHTKTPWSAEDVLLLLEYIEECAGNWDLIGAKFGSKYTKDDCILKFLQLPINESSNLKYSEFVYALQHSQAPNGSETESNCFGDISNPILTQIGLFTKELERYAQIDEDKHKRATRKTNQEEENILLGKKHLLSCETVQKIKDKSTRRAQKLARKEERNIKRLVSMIMEVQMKKLELKMAHFNEFERFLFNEMEHSKSIQSQIFAERVALTINKNELLYSSQHRKKYSDLSRRSSIAEAKLGGTPRTTPQKTAPKEVLPLDPFNLS